MDSAKPKSGEDNDDVILYMDELPSSKGVGLSEYRLQRDDVNNEESIIRPSPSLTTLDAKPKRRESSRHLETDNVNNSRQRPENPDVEVFDPETYDRVPVYRDPLPGIDDGLFPDPKDEIPSMVPSSPRHRPNEMPNFPGFCNGSSPPDVNVYQQKKTIAQGMMDLALISANANQFRYVLQTSGQHPYYYPSLAMIGLSLILQVIVGIGLIWNSRYNVKDETEIIKANRANNLTVMAIFLVTILNVFISSFGVVESRNTGFF